MSTLNYSVTINGHNYDVETDDGRRQRSHQFCHIRSTEITITEIFGECNPLNTFWEKFEYHLRGAAKQAKITKIIKDFVIDEISAHKNFCLELLENGEIDLATGLEIE